MWLLARAGLITDKREESDGAKAGRAEHTRRVSPRHGGTGSSAPNVSSFTGIIGKNLSNAGVFRA